MNMTELCDSKFNNAALLLHVDVITIFLSSVSTYLKTTQNGVVKG